MDNSVRIEILPESTGATESTNDICTEKSSLDTYIYDLYDTELKFQIEDSEVKHIQACVETLVESLVKCTLQSQMYKKHMEKATQLEVETDKDDYIHKLKCVKDVCSVPKEQILSVGSFYEGTRNTFPEEFDYIAVLLEFPERLWSYLSHNETILNGFHDALHHVVISNTNDFEHVNLQLVRVVRTSGPASKLEFVYKKGLISQHMIHVDISPALRPKIEEQSFGESLTKTLLRNEQWYHRVMKTGHYLNVLIYNRETGNSLHIVNTIVETELRFMTKEISFNHTVAYRFLKYLLSRQNEEMQDYLFRRKVKGNWKKCDFSSYLVKTLLYKHVSICPSDSSVGKCCLEMLLFLQRRFLAAEEEESVRHEVTPYLETILGGHLKFCTDLLLTKKFEHVLKSYILTLQKFQNGCLQTKPVFNSLAAAVKPSIKRRLNYEHCCYIFLKWILKPLLLLVVIGVVFGEFY